MRVANLDGTIVYRYEVVLTITFSASPKRTRGLGSVNIVDGFKYYRHYSMRYLGYDVTNQ